MLQLANHSNIALNQETLLLLHLLDGFEHYGLLKHLWIFYYKHLVYSRHLYLLWSIEVKPSNGCSNSNVSFFKTMLEWLANCTVEDSSF